MKRIPKIIALLVLLLITLPGIGQGISIGHMAEKMRGDGRIYVVIAVILTILAGLILYMIWIDRKISKLEKER